MKKVSFLISLGVCLILVIIPAVGHSIDRYKGQTVYAVASHNCFKYDDSNCIRMARTRLIIRNIDPNNPINVTSIVQNDPRVSNF